MLSSLLILLFLISALFNVSTYFPKLILQSDSLNVSIEELRNYQPVLVCNLTTEQQYEQVKKLRTKIFKYVRKTVEYTDGYEFTFHEPIDFSIQLIEYINFERKCCPSFAYTLTISANEGPIQLKVGGAPDIKEILKIFLNGTIRNK